MIFRIFIFCLSCLLVGSQDLFARPSSEEPNLELTINRRMVHRFTDVLKSYTPGVDSVVFDLRDQRLDVTVILKQSQIPFLRFVTPTYKPGEIFRHNSLRKGGASSQDVKDFLVGFQFSFKVEMKPGEQDSVYLSFDQPMVAAYYAQDFNRYREILKELGEVISKGDGLRYRIIEVNRELGNLPQGREGTARKIRLLKEKISLHENYQINSAAETSLQKEVVRFSSGSHLNMLPSDEVLSDLLKSVEGRRTGDGILQDVYSNVKKMKIIHEGLEFKLLGAIKNRKGVLKVSNLGSVLAGYLPGLKITRAEIQKLPPLPSNGMEKSTPRDGNYQLVFEGKVSPRGGK